MSDKMTSPDDRALWRERMEKISQDGLYCFHPSTKWDCPECPIWLMPGVCRQNAAAYLEHDKEG